MSRKNRRIDTHDPEATQAWFDVLARELKPKRKQPRKKRR